MEELKGNYEESLEIINSHISGEITLVEEKKFIEVDLDIKASNVWFKYARGRYDIIEVGDFKALVFGYYHIFISSKCDNEDLDSGSPNMPIKEKVLYSSFKNWNKGDKVRVILFNEKDEAVFRAMRPYFIEFLSKFEDKPISQLDLDVLNKDWNLRFPDYSLNDNCSSRIDPLTQVIMTPRILRDGGVLSLKLRP